MAQLIDKSALVAEIEDWRDKIRKGIFDIPLTGRDRAYATFEYEILGKIKDFIDTLEAKEVGVDLGDPKGDKSAKYIIDTKTLEVKEVQEPTASDKGMVEEIINNLKRVEQDYHIDLTREMEWLRNLMKKGEPVSRTPYDIEAAMQEVEEKSRAFTEAHKGEDTDNILAQMRGEEPVSEGLEEAAMQYAKLKHKDATLQKIVSWDFNAGAKWQKEHLWEPADGDNLPAIDREVIALLNNGKVVYAHRPNPDGWNGKNILTGEVRHYDVQTYDKGGWNIPDVKYWLDCELPKI